MNSRDALLGIMATLLDVAGTDDDLDGCIAALSAACLAIANHDEEEFVTLVIPYCDRVTARDCPDIWAEVQAIRNSQNN